VGGVKKIGPKKGIKKEIYYTLNSLSVRVPHNISKASIADPGPESVVRTGFTVKPMFFWF